MIICINPDEDPGQPGSTVDPFIQERDLNVIVCNALSRALQRCGQTVYWDEHMTFEQLIGQANALPADLVLAVGHNGGGGSYALTILCPGGEGQGQQSALAAAIAAEVGAYTGQPGKQLSEQLAVLCQTNMDAVFIEPGFMDDPTGHFQSLYHSDTNAYAEAVAEAITRGVASVKGFPFVPVAPPEQPEWEKNLVAEGHTFTLSKAVDVYSFASSSVVGQVAGGSGLSTSWVTTVGGVGYYLTQYGKEHGNGLLRHEVDAAAQVPVPPPTPTPTPPPAPDDDTQLEKRIDAIESWARDLGFKG